MDVKIEPHWKEILKPEFNKPYFQQIVLHLKTEKTQNKIIYPPGSQSSMHLIQHRSIK